MSCENKWAMQGELRRTDMNGENIKQGWWMEKTLSRGDECQQRAQLCWMYCLCQRIKCSPSEMSCENKWDMPIEITWPKMSSARGSAHSAKDRQIEDGNGHKQNRWDLNVHHHRWAVKIGEICKESWRDQRRHQLGVMNVNKEFSFAGRLAKSVRQYTRV